MHILHAWDLSAESWSYNELGCRRDMIHIMKPFSQHIKVSRVLRVTFYDAMLEKSQKEIIEFYKSLVGVTSPCSNLTNGCFEQMVEYYHNQSVASRVQSGFNFTFGIKSNLMLHLNAQVAETEVFKF